MDKFKKKIQEQAKSTQGTRTDLTSSPNGEKVKSTHTDKELAKMAGVGTGTVAGFNRVKKNLDSDNEEFKQEVLQVRKVSMLVINVLYKVKIHSRNTRYSVMILIIYKIWLTNMCTCVMFIKTKFERG